MGMNSAVRRWRTTGILAVLVLICASRALAQTDPLEAARTKGRPALIHFTGSDWCANCKAFERDVLAKEDVHAAISGFVHYTADRPVRRKLDPDTERINSALVERFNPANTFPLLVVVSPDGRVLDRIGFERGAPAASYVERLRKWSTAP